MSAKNKTSFYSFVLTYYRNDPYLMLESFRTEISDIAAEVSIDWPASEDNLTFSDKLFTGSDVVGLEGADDGRCSILLLQKTDTGVTRGVPYEVKYPLIMFTNFRKGFCDGAGKPQPVYFAGLKYLWAKYNEMRVEGVRPVRAKVDESSRALKLENVNKKRLEKEALRAEAVQKDFAWWPYLAKCSQSDYFTSKGAWNICVDADLRHGHTDGYGRFEALPLTDATGLFRGIQRYYHSEDGCKKRFRKGLNPDGAFIQIGSITNGQPIFVLEAAANAGLAYRLTNTACVAALYVDNYFSVVTLLRSRYPLSPISIVCDNDLGLNERDGEPGKGVTVAMFVAKSVPLVTWLVPPLSLREREQGNTDICDLWKLRGDRGDEVVLRFLQQALS